jgi:pimeloyl-ACP methyl ester carboxylesterase
MASLASKLSGHKVTTHAWTDHEAILKSLKSQKPDQRVVIIGYSMGANSATWIVNQDGVGRVDLLVLYDPSVGLPGLPAYVYPIPQRVARTIHYRGWSFLGWGRARVTGHKVETTQTWWPHEAIDWYGHSKVLQAIQTID